MHDRFGARCKAAKATKAAKAVSNFAYIILYTPVQQCQCSGLRKWLRNGAAKDSLHRRRQHLLSLAAVFLSYLQLCLHASLPLPECKGWGDSIQPWQHNPLLNRILVERCSSFTCQLTAHCAVTQIAWKSIILEIEIDVFLTVRQKCFEACLILLSRLSSFRLVSFHFISFRFVCAPKAL